MGYLHTVWFRSNKMCTFYLFLYTKYDIYDKKDNHRSRKSYFQNSMKMSAEVDQNDAS